MDHLKISRLCSCPLNVIFGVCIVISVLSSCADEENVISDQSRDFSYFPLVKNLWTEYDADSIIHLATDDQNEVDTDILFFHFRIREVIDSEFVDAENQTAYSILRYRRDNDSLPWELTNVWTAKVNPFSAQKVEDNIRFVKLKFPINSSATWNGNAYNYYQEEEYTYEELYEPRTYAGLSFDSTITVLQNDFISNINRVYKKEIYAAHTGLLYKQLDSVNTLNTGTGTIILNGLEYRLSITGHGN